tara:strand:+ start:393 stop:596 length:204 start_codon:yes stop_codon:yes gene_type:complete
MASGRAAVGAGEHQHTIEGESFERGLKQPVRAPECIEINEIEALLGEIGTTQKHLSRFLGLMDAKRG